MISDMDVNKRLDNKLDTIHNFESQVSDSSASHESESVNVTDSNLFTEMRSEMNTNNMNSENSQGDFETNTYDTLRQFHPRKMSDMYGSNQMKY